MLFTIKHKTLYRAEIRYRHSYTRGEIMYDDEDFDNDEGY